MKWRIFLALGLIVSLLPMAGVASAAPPAQEEVYTVQKDDSLWGLAEKYLGSGSAYPSIVMATNATSKEDATFTYIADPGLIQPGWKLVIPGTAEAEEMLAEPQAITMTLFEEPDSLNRAYTTMWYALIVLDMLNPGLWERAHL
jgi:LysM repeat protein